MIRTKNIPLELEANSLCIGEDQSHRNKKKKKEVSYGDNEIVRNVEDVKEEVKERRRLSVKSNSIQTKITRF